MMQVVPMRIGSKYQADLPELLPLDQRSAAQRGTSDVADGPASLSPSAAPRYKQRWTPSRFTSEEVVEFLRSFCRLNEVEMGLQCLYESDFQVQTAVQLLHAARRRKARKQRAEDEHVSDEAFGSAIAAHGKKFFLIQQQFEHVGTGDIIRRFYLWKTSAAYARWRERIKARRSKETARLRTWGDSEDSETSDFHNEYCELCFTGGQLLCCDGCERAYHFSCVTPPINEIPNGDWFCSHCSTILETSLSIKQSDENENVDELVLDDNDDDHGGDDDDDDDDDGSVGEASDVETLDLEDIDDEDGAGNGYEQLRVTYNRDGSEQVHSESSGSGRPSPMRTASSTDNDESDSGLKARLASSGDGHFASLKIKQEPDSVNVRSEPSPLKAEKRRSSELRKFVKPALALELSSSERKRKRKIEAPRRIPQPRSNF